MHWIADDILYASVWMTFPLLLWLWMTFPLLLWHCWLGDRNGIWPAKIQISSEVLFGKSNPVYSHEVDNTTMLYVCGDKSWKICKVQTSEGSGKFPYFWRYQNSLNTQCRIHWKEALLSAPVHVSWHCPHYPCIYNNKQWFCGHYVGQPVVTAGMSV